MIVSTIGYGATGSGAVYDLLREFSSIQSINDAEFKLAYQVDGLQDLEYHLTKQYSKNISGDAAIRRYIKLTDYYTKVPFTKKIVDKSEFERISKKYISSLIQTNFRGLESIDTEVGSIPSIIVKLAFKKKIIPIYQHVTKSAYNFWPIRPIYVSIEPENFLEKTRNYVKELLLSTNVNLDGIILLNQAFEANNPKNSMKFFPNSKAILLDRDPRDLYIQHQLMESAEGRWLPRGDVDSFIIQYKQMRIGKIKNFDKDILSLQFENLIYDYENSLYKIKKFLNLEDAQHHKKKKYFIPEKSVNNTQLFKIYPQFENEILKIEKELKSFLFDFSNFEKIKRTGSPFNA
ncbi:hypothetical protein [Enterococcus faecium]|uniref:hypothetical protein n=1 Tax=Enterococcus faecium TaxID=1352 RepID=UPI0024333E67|nr:hypothetical protein [Enterococcus faecium]